MTNFRTIAKLTRQDVLRCWKPLFATDFVFKLLALIVLAPLVSILFRLLLWFSGSSFLSDEDIAFFILTPIGIPTTLLIGALQAAIVLLGLATLFVVLADNSGTPPRPTVAIRHALSFAPSIIKLNARMIGWLSLIAAPFLILIVGIYLVFLGEHDINFYLHQRPPEFRTAVILASGVVVLLLIVWTRLGLNWFFALPIVLFEKKNASESLQLSCQRVRGLRLRILGCILVWLLVMAIISSSATALTIGVTRILLPGESASLFQLTLTIGVAIVGWILVNAAISLLGSSSFAALCFNLYRDHPDSKSGESVKSPLRDSAARPARPSSRARFIALTLVGFLVSCTLGVALLRSVQVEDQVNVIAHRGASLNAPENTMAAIKLAIEDGADWVEIDVQETADGEVVVFHDSDFMKLSGNPLKIWDAKMDDLKNIDIGSWFSAEFSDQRVPTLDRVLKACKGKAGVFIELKSYGRGKKLEERVAEIVEANDMVDEIVIMSLKLEAVKKMKSLRPGWTVGFLMSVSAGNLAETDADFLAVNAAFADRNFIRSAHNMGMRVYVWTVNDAVGMSNLISRGVDGIITDRPDLARSVLQQRAEMSVPQRLLLEFAKILGKSPEFVEQ